MRALISEEEASQYAAQEIIAAGGKADPKSEKSGECAGSLLILSLLKKEHAGRHPLPGSFKNEIKRFCRTLIGVGQQAKASDVRGGQDAMQPLAKSRVGKAWGQRGQSRLVDIFRLSQ